MIARHHAGALCACALALSVGAVPRRSAAQTPYKIAEGHLRIESVSALAQPSSPVVPRNTVSAVRVVVRAGEHEMTSEEVAESFGEGFRIQAELSGPGLPQTVTLPRPGDPPLPDPLLLVLPPLGRAGNYELRGMRIAAADGHAVLDVTPQATTLRVIEQVLITSVQTRPLTRDEIRERGILLDNQAYLGFEFTLTLRLESEPVRISYPVVFDRQMIPHPPAIPLPPLPDRTVQMPPLPTIVPMMLRTPPGPNGGGGGGGGGGDDLGGARIPSVLVIPGNVGYLRQFFAAQLLVANGAPAGSGLSVRSITATIRLPRGPDQVPGTADDPLALPPLESGPAPSTLPVRGVGPDGEPGTGDDVDVLAPSEQGQAEFLVRGDQEGYHNLDFDIAAVLDGLPTGSKNLTGTAKGGVLVRNPYFDVAFTAPSVVRAGERFKLYATLTNLGRSTANDLNVTLDASRLSGAHLACPSPSCGGTVVVGTLTPGDARTVEFLLESERTGEVVASYLRFEPGLQGRLNFTVGVGERGVPLSPDTLVLPASVDALPGSVVNAAMRVLGQAWSIVQAAPSELPGQVLPTDATVVQKKALALAEAGMRVQLGQPVAAAIRDLAFDFYGGTPLDTGFDQLLRTTEAGRDFALALGAELSAAAGGSPLGYEEAVARIAASGPDSLTFAVQSTGTPVTASLTDALGRRSEAVRDGSRPLSEIPGAALLPLGAPATAPWLGVVTAPDKAPYTLVFSGPAAMSVSFPRGGGRFSRATWATSHPARILVDFARDEITVQEDTDGDGVYEAQRTEAAADFGAEGARLLSATLVGPETLDGATALGLQTALLFDRLVDPATAADKANYQVPGNGVAAAKRQLSGRLVFASLKYPEGPYVTSAVTATGIRDARGVAGPALTVPLQTRVTGVGAVLSGKVVEADGRPVAGALVRYLNSSSCDSPLGEVAVVPAAEDGRYQIRYVRQSECGGPFEIAVYDPVTGARRSVQLHVRTAGEQLVADIALLGRGSVTGVVRDAAGQPVPGAYVRVVSVTDPLVGALTQADGDGRYLVHEITVGGVNATAVAGLLVGRGAGRIEQAGTTAVVDVRLEGQSARISGAVRKLENGVSSVVPGIAVLYSLRPGGELVGVAYTDGDGRYALEGMPAGDFKLEARLNTRDRATVLYRADPGQTIENLDLVIEIPPETSFGTVRGTVRLPNGNPGAGVVVTIDGRGVLSAANGSYEITGVALPSNPKVMAVTTDGARTGSAYAVLTAQQPVAEGIDVTLSGMGHVDFTVLDAAGNPVPLQSVGLQWPGCANACGCDHKDTGTDGRVSWDVPLGTWGAKAVRWTNGKAEVGNGSANLTIDGFTAYGVLRLAGYGTVRGTVVDSSNNAPLHGATVVLTANRFAQETCDLQQVVIGTRQTDANGAFEFGDVNAGPVTALATHPIVSGSATAGATLAGGQVVTLDLGINSGQTMAGELSGTVFLPDGTTPAGADVEVTVKGALPEVTVHTTADGVFRFPEILPQGHYRLTARDPLTGGVAGKSIYLRAVEAATHDLRLLGRGTVVVKVVDGGGNEVESALVRLRGTEFPNKQYEGAIQPGMGAQVTIGDVVEGPYAVEASDAFGRGGRASFVLPGPGLTVEVRVGLTVVGTVRGHFLMPDASPIAFGTVKLVASGRAIGQVTTAGSGDIGYFSFSYVPAGPLRLEALDPATGRTGIAVGSLESEGQNVTLDIRAQALGTVEGVVTSNGAPEPGALVDIVSGTYRVSTAADTQGLYRVVGVPEGRVAVNASLSGGYLKATREETLLGEGSVLTVDMALRPTGTVEGTVTEADGQTPALAVASLSLYGVGGGQFARPTNEQGRFEFLRVAAGRGRIAADELGSIDVVEASIEVPEGATLQVPLRLNGVGSLRGIARDSGGGPTAGWLWVQGSGPYPYWRSLNVGPNGVFGFPELMAGPFTLTLRVTSGGTTLYGTASGVIAPDQETQLDVQLEPSGTVTGLVLRPGSTGPAFGANVTLTHSKGTSTAQAQGDGRFTVYGVPLGPVTVRIQDPITAGRAVIAGRAVGTNQEIVDLGSVVLDNVPPANTPVDPLDGGTRAKLADRLVADLTDDLSGIDTSSFLVRYSPFVTQNANAFTFTNGRVEGLLSAANLVIGQNTITLSVKDLAGNVTERPLTFTITGATARGTVRWSDGTPAAGVEVRVDGTAPAATDGDGGYVKTGLRSGRSEQATDPVSGISKTVYVPIYDGEDTVVNITLPAFGWIVGSVQRANGTPAGGVTVAYGTRITTTAGDGSFSLGAFEVGTYTITATEAGSGDIGTVTVSVASGQTAQAVIRLNGVGHVVVNVRDANGAAVQNAAVSLVSSPVGRTYQGQTNQSGTADFPLVLAGTIAATARDLVRNLAGQAGGLLQPNGTLTLDVTLAGAGTVTGTIRYPDGSAAKNVAVWCSPPNTSTTTDPEGRFSVASVPLGPFQVRADAPGGDQATGSGTLTANGQTVNVDLTLHGTGAVTVRVVDSFGNPAGGLNVRAWSSSNSQVVASATTDADGNVAFPAILAGEVTADVVVPITYQTGRATGTLAAGGTLALSVQLTPVGTIRGRVFQPDGVTPAGDVEVRVGTWNWGSLITRSGADGSYELPGLPLGWYTVDARVSGRLRARASGVQITANGQIVERDLVLIGVGTVTGLVTDPQGAAASNAAITLTSTGYPYVGTFTTTTGSDGRYSVSGVAVGPFSISAARIPLGQRVDARGTVTADGQTVQMDLQMLSSFVTLPLTLTDGNRLPWYVYEDGSTRGASVVYSSRRASRLSLVTGGTTYQFTGNGASAASEEDKRETVITQTLGGVGVTRKAFVPATGYFLRFLDVFDNPSAEPVTVEALYHSELGDLGTTPAVIDTSSGDAALTPEDRWALLDDSVDEDIYEPPSGMYQNAPLGIAAYGAGALQPSSVTYAGYDLTQSWLLTIPPQGRIALMQVLTPQADRARGRASAERLEQLPPELLEGLAPEEAAAIANFAVPPDLVSAVPPLPLNDGVISGQVKAVDGTTAVKDAVVKFRSRSPHYGRPLQYQYSTGNDGSYSIRSDSTPGSMDLVPRVPFDVKATLATGFGTQVAQAAGEFAQSGNRDVTFVPGVTFNVSTSYPHACCVPGRAVDRNLATVWQSASGDSTTRGTTPFFEVVFPAPVTVNEVRIRGRRDGYDSQTIRQARVEVRDGAASVLWSAEVTMPPPPAYRDADVPVPAVAGARAVRIVDLADGGLASLAEVYVFGEADAGTSHAAVTDVQYVGKAMVSGRVLRADGSPVPNSTVRLANGSNVQNKPATSPDGEYLHAVVPPGAYTLTATHPAGGVSVTIPDLLLPADQATVQDLVYPAFGTLQGAFFTAANQPVNGRAAISVNGTVRSTGNEPSYRFDDVPPGAYDVLATDIQRSNAQMSATVSVSANATVQQDFVFPPVGTVEVHATVGAVPLNRGLVYYRSASRGPDWIWCGYTDGAGIFRIANVPGPDFTVKVQHPDSVYSYGLATGTLSEGQTVVLPVAVPGVGTVAGVLRTRNGVAVASGTVTILSPSDSTVYGSATANASGAFQIANVPVGPFRIRGKRIDAAGGTNIVDEGELSAALTTHDQTLSADALVSRGILAPGEKQLWELTLAEGERARILQFGMAIGSSPAMVDPYLEVHGPSGALAAANDDRSGQDPNSEVDFTAAQAGVYLVVARAAAPEAGGYRLGTYNPSVLVLRPYAGTAVHGAITRQADGSPVAGVTVRLVATWGALTVTRSAVTDSAGQYSIDGVLADASVTAELLDGDGTVLATASSTTGNAGTTLELPLVSPSLGTVEVTALLGTQPFHGLAVTVTSDNPYAAPGLRTAQGTTGVDGRFALSRTPAGAILARATDPVTGDPLEASGTLAEGANLGLELQLTQGTDQAPPSAVTDLSAVAMGPGHVRLTWTAPGDDGTVGTAAAYDLRYSTEPVTAANFAAAAPVLAPTPGPAGSLQATEIAGLSVGSTYYFAVMARDEAFNWSPLSNVASASPSLPTAGLKLWLRADAGVTTDGASEYVASWADQSGNGNHATQSLASARPLRAAGEANGLPVLRFDGNSDVLNFTTRLTTVRTVFWVVRETATTDGTRFLLSDSSTYDFFAGTQRQIWHSVNAHTNVRNGETRVDGQLVNGTITNRPTAFSVVSLVTTGNVTAGNFGRDRGGSYYWWGDLAELIVYDRPLSDDERRQVEDYLAERYAVYAPPRRAPTISPNGGSFSEPVTVTLNGSALIRYTLDGTDPTDTSAVYTDPFVVSPPVTVKARAYAADGTDPSPVATVTFLSTAQFTPAGLAGLKLWVRADAGVSADPAIRASSWQDQSGQGNSLVQAGPWSQPTLLPNAAGGLPALSFDGNSDYLGFTTGLTTIRTVFWVIRETATTDGARFLLGDATNYDFWAGAQHQIWNVWNASSYIRSGETRVNGTLVNGTTANRPTTLSVVSLVTTGNVRANNFSKDRTNAWYWWGDLAELVIYDTPLSDTDRRAVEEYLAARYGIALQP